jgi:hypothetical protein
VHHYPATRLSFGNLPLQLYFRLAQIFRGNRTEEITGHHAPGCATDDPVAEWASSIAQDNFVLVSFNYIKIALNTPLGVDQHISNLLTCQVGDGGCPLVIAVILISYSLTDDTYKTGSFVDTDAFLQPAGQFPKETPEKNVAID